MRDFKNDYEGHNLELAGIVFNATTEYSPEETLSKARVREMAKERGWYVFNAEVPYSRSYPKGAREGQPIFRTSYSRGHQVARFNIFAQEFAKRIAL
jgi:chromosome partitioning protein